MENKKYSILFVALYCYTGHVIDLVNHLKAKNPLVDVTILTDDPNAYTDSLTDKSVKIVHYAVPPFNSRIRRLRFLVIQHRQRKFFSNFCKGRRYDIVNVHFPNRYMSCVIKSLRAMSDNIVISPWGSDILRRDETSLKRLAKLYEKADYVTTPADSQVGMLITQKFKVPLQKMVGNGIWGTAVVDFAIKNGDSISQEDAKARFGLAGQYVITCGYNRQEAQQHKAIIAAIDQNRDLLPKNLTLLFPMTYGDMFYQGKYVEVIKEECKKRNLRALFSMDFLSIEDLYKLRKATDIFVHVQTTDAGARSVYEYILCNKKIVHGSWVKYRRLEEYKPLFYFPVDKLEDLGNVIVKAYNSDNIIIPQGVMDIVLSRSWDNKMTQLNDFFMSIVYK